MTTLSTAVLGVLVAGLVGILLLAVVRREVPAAVNAVLMLVVTAIPLAIAGLAPVLGGRQVMIGIALPLWIATAGFVHALGMLGPYDTVWWWDLVTHAISAALVASLVLAGVVVLARHTGVVPSAPAMLGLLTVGLTAVGGIFWELVELVARAAGRRFDVEPVLIHYGWRDTALDLVVDVLAAVGIVLLDLRLFVPIAAQAPAITTGLVVVTGAILVGGTVLLAVVVAVIGALSQSALE